jgi:hypothetical protein
MLFYELLSDPKVFLAVVSELVVTIGNYLEDEYPDKSNSERRIIAERILKHSSLSERGVKEFLGDYYKMVEDGKEENYTIVDG